MKVLSYQGIPVEATLQDHWNKKSTKVANTWFADEEKGAMARILNVSHT